MHGPEPSRFVHQVDEFAQINIDARYSYLTNQVRRDSLTDIAQKTKAGEHPKLDAVPLSYVATVGN